MWALIKNNKVDKIFSNPEPFIDDSGIQHPKGIFTKWSSVELKNINLLPYTEAEYDERYYNKTSVTYVVSENSVEGTPVIEEKDLALLKEEMLIAVSQRVEELLNKYDWMTHREVEGGTPMPDNIKTYRANLRAENNTKEIEINSITTMDDFIAYDITYKTVI